MKSITLVSVVTCLLLGAVLCTSEEPKFTGNIWAVLVAGSNEYYNYRHQADVCHAYQVLKSHGIPDERIIVMMYDDIANHSWNPTPGIIINKPGGKDVYHGVPKDYTGKSVTPKMFLKVLLGDEELAKKGKKVLKSTADDHVFIYFSDHGAPGLVAFPDDELSATDLMKTLKQMNKKKAYKQLVFYLEACESGSMFENLLPDNMNILAVTAANSEESSYACYYDDKRETYLGDLFSVKWIEDSEKHSDLDSESLQEQYKVVKKETNTSHVMEYGDLKMASEPVGQFQGEAKAPIDDETPHVDASSDAVPSEDVPLMIVLKKAQAEQDALSKQILMAKYASMVQGRAFMKSVVKSLMEQFSKKGVVSSNSDLLGERKTLKRFPCYEHLYKVFDNHCFDLSIHPYSLRQLYTLVNVCESMPEVSRNSLQRAADVIKEHCAHNDVPNSQLAWKSIV